MNASDDNAPKPARRRRASAAQLAALKTVAAGRAEYGSEYPERDRRAAARGRSLSTPTFLVDGAGLYGAQHTTWQAIEQYGWITVRHDLLPTRAVAERIAVYTDVSGANHTQVLPAHREPADPGWRAAVELTDAGRATLDSSMAIADEGGLPGVAGGGVGTLDGAKPGSADRPEG